MVLDLAEMKNLAVLNLILLVAVGHSFAFDANEDYLDPILYYLLNGNDTELSKLYDKSNEEVDLESTPVFIDGIWKCGNCDNVNENKLIYNEINDVESNIDDDNFLQVQVGLVFEEMRCVTIQSDEKKCKLEIVTGSCTGPTVTLYVSNAQQFDVRVYRD